MEFDGLKPWTTTNPVSVIEVADSGEIYDIHSEWSLSRITIENIGEHGNVSMHFIWAPELKYGNKNSSDDFTLSFSNTSQLSILPEFGAEGGPYDSIDEFSYWSRDDIGYIELFGAMRRIQFTFEKVSLKLHPKSDN